MSTSLGYVLMNWTSAFSKKKPKKKEKVVILSEQKCCQVDLACQACEEKAKTVENLSTDLEQVKTSSEEMRKKLSSCNKSLAITMEKEYKLRTSHETLILEEAQVRYELDQLRKQLSEQLEQRDQAHAERMKLLEKTLQDKECEWAKKNEVLRKDLRETIRSSIQDTEREAESLGNLEQEIASLRMVVDMRSSENRELRIHNNELMAQVDRLSYLETELANARHRLDEMTLVLQHKMDSERELLELSETLQNELVKSRSEAMQSKMNVENRQYLMQNQQQQRPTLKVQHSHSELIPTPQQHHRNNHQQASSGNDLIMNVREKNESVAWMIQMPTSGTASPSNQRRNLKSK